MTLLLGPRQTKLGATDGATHNPSDVRHVEHCLSLGTLESSARSEGKYNRYVGIASGGAAYDVAQLGDAKFVVSIHALLDQFGSQLRVLREFRPPRIWDFDTASDSVRCADRTDFRSQPLPFHVVLSLVSWLPSSGIR